MLNRAISLITRTLAGIAGVTLFCLMLVITACVILRYLFNAPIFGSQDIIEVMLVPVAVLALAHGAHTNGHVAVDLASSAIGRVGRLIGDALTYGLGAILFYFLLTHSWHEMLDVREWGDSTNLLEVPLWPFYVMISLSSLMMVVVYVFRLFELPVKFMRGEV